MSRRIDKARRNPPHRPVRFVPGLWTDADGLSAEWKITPTTWTTGITDAGQIDRVSFGFDRGEPLSRRKRIVRRIRGWLPW